MPQDENVKLCTNCSARQRAGKRQWCRHCLNAQRNQPQKRRGTRALAKASRLAARDWQRPLQPRMSGGR